MHDNNETYFDDDINLENGEFSTKPEHKRTHQARKSLEDLLEEQALKKRLQDIYDDDYLLD